MLKCTMKGTTETQYGYCVLHFLKPIVFLNWFLMTIHDLCHQCYMTCYWEAFSNQ